MKENIKKILLNSIIIFIMCFLFLFIFQTYQDYEYYSVYSKEDLAQFFSMKKVVLWDLKQSFYWSIRQIIIFVPILLILEKTKIKNIAKIIITLVLTFIISFIYIMLNLIIIF